MVTFANDVNGNAPLYYIAITITNSQTTATGTNFQQMITVDSNTTSSYYASNLSNVNFQDGSSNILKSWLESGETNTSTATNYWVLLANGIGASSNVTIYLVLYATTSTSKDSTTTGAEPNYTGTYGQYDNGASVFNKYWNFAGTSTPSGLTNTGSGISYSNGLTISLGAAWGTYVATTSTIPLGTVIESLMAQTSGASGALVSLIASTSSGLGSTSYALSTVGGSPITYNYVAGYNNGGSGFPWATIGSALAGDANYHIFSMGITSSGTLGFGDIGYTSYSGTSSAETLTSFYIGLQNTQQTAKWQWLRTRTYPPAGIMPTTSAGSITSTVITYSVTNTETESDNYKRKIIYVLKNIETESTTYHRNPTTLHPIFTDTANESDIVNKAFGMLVSNISHESDTYIKKLTYPIQNITIENDKIFRKLSRGLTDIATETFYWIIKTEPSITNATGGSTLAIIEGYDLKMLTYISSISTNITTNYLPIDTNVLPVTASSLSVNTFSFTDIQSISSNTAHSTLSVILTDSATIGIPNISISLVPNANIVLASTLGTTDSAGTLNVAITSYSTVASSNTVVANSTLLGYVSASTLVF